MNVGGRIGAALLLGFLTGGCVVAPGPSRRGERAELGTVAAPLIGLGSGEAPAGERSRAAAGHEDGGDGEHEDPDAELSWLDGADPEPDPWHDDEGGERSGAKDGSTDDELGQPAPESSDGGAEETKGSEPGSDTLGPDGEGDLDGDSVAAEPGSPDESAEAQASAD